MANSNIEKKTLSWEQMPKIIDYDNEEEDIKSENKLEEDVDLHLGKMNDEPYVHFRRLGYCALDSNERANFKARELKSIRLDIEGEYIRLVARRCHSNHLNQHNQVGLVGITIMGEPIDDLLDGESQTIPLEHVDNDVSRVSSPESCVVPVIQENSSLREKEIESTPLIDHKNGDFASLYSILPSSGNDSVPEKPIDFLQNNEQTATLISVFNKAKEAAVKAEDFHAAKVYKNSIELVERSVDQIEELDALKKKAVEEEDFDNAAKFKYDIDAIKTLVQNSIITEGIQLDENGEVTVFDADLADIVGIADHYQPQVPEPSPPIEPVSGKNTQRIHKLENFPIDASESAGRDPQRRQHGRINELQVDAIAKDECLRRSPSPLNLAPKSRTSSNASCVNPAVFSSETVSDQEPNTPTKTNPAIWEHYEDERPLPALANVKSSPTISPSAPNDVLAEDEPEELSELARSAFALSVQVFGDRIVAGFMSKKFKCRESALVEVTQRLDVEGAGLDVENVDKLAMVKAAFQLLQEGLNDNREKLTLQVLNLWETLTNFSVHHQIPQSATSKLIEQNYPALFSKISDTNPRIKQTATDLFVMLSKTYRSPNQTVVSLVLKPSHSQTQPPKQAKAKVELVARLVNEFGVALIPKGKFEKDVGLSVEGIMEVAVSYLNHSNGEVREAAVKLAVDVCRYTDRSNIEPYLEGVKPMLVETIRQLSINLPPPPPVVTMLDVDESLLHRPLAKRGTVARLEQQLMELKAMMNNVNHFVADDYNSYIANTLKNAPPVSVSEDGDHVENTTPAPQSVKGDLPSQKKEIGKVSKAAASNPSKTPTTAAARKLKKDSDADLAHSRKQNSSTKPHASSNARTAPSSNTKNTNRKGATDETSHNKSSKTASKTAPKPVEPPSNTVDEDDDTKGDRCCIFCDEHNDDFTEENLVTHYWNECPVLTKCPLCNIILEISTLDDHMLNDCDKSKFVKKCPRCREVIPADSYLEHVAKQTCMVIPAHIVRCPLCKNVVKPATEAGWKAHLLDVDGCSKNRRKDRPAIGKPTSSAVTPPQETESINGKRPRRTPNEPPKSLSNPTNKTISGRKTVSGSAKDKTRKVTAKTKTKST